MLKTLQRKVLFQINTHYKRDIRKYQRIVILLCGLVFIWLLCRSSDGGESLDSYNVKDIEMDPIEIKKFRRWRFNTYTFNEAKRRGPGEHGRAYIMTGEMQIKGSEAMRKDGFNYIASDMISFDRSLWDLRSQQ